MNIDENDNLGCEWGSDLLLEKAIEIIRQTGKASAPYLQRRLKIGYNQASRIIEEMERRGIVGSPNGAKPRDVLHIREYKVDKI